MEPTNRQTLPEDSTDLSRRTRSALFWMGSTTAVWHLITWLLTMLTARILTPTDYGLAAVVEFVLPFLALAARLDITDFIAQRKELDPEDEKTLLSLSIVTGAAVAIAGQIVAPLLARFYDSPQLIWPLRVIALTFFVRAFGIVPDALLRRELNFKTVGLINFATGVSRGILQLVLAYLGFGYWALIIGLIFRDVGVALWSVAARGLPKGLGWDKKVLRDALAYGIPVTSSTICFIVYSQADNMVVARFFGLEVLGFYSMAFYLTDLPMSKLNMILRPVMIPYFGRIQSSLLVLRESFLRITRVYALIIFPIMIGLGVVADLAVPVLLGAKWHALVYPLQVMCAVGLIRAFVDNISPLFLGAGRPKKNLLLNFSFMLLVGPCYYLLGRTIGLEGVFAAWLVVFPVVSFLGVLALREVISLSPLLYISNLRAPFISAICMGIFVLTFRHFVAQPSGAITALVANIAVGVAAYAAVLFVVFRKEATDALQTMRGMRA